MIRVLFFARLRESLRTDELQFSEAEAGGSVAMLRDRLAQRGDRWAEAMGAENLLCAVNQMQVDSEHEIADGDEVAFFPPVTGG